MAEISIWIRVGGGALVIVLLGWFYFILMGSGKKGKFGIITLGLVGLFIYHPVFEILALVLLVGLIAGIKIRLNFHKGEYEIAAARMEGGGIKRGLLASEAAVLLGKPFEIAMAASIVSLLKRGVLYTNTINQMIIGVESGFRVEGTGAKFDEREEIRMKSALKRNVVLFPHELLFLELLEGHAEKPLNTIELDIIIRPLIKLLVERLGGYDIEQSRQYYSKVVEMASFEARSDGSLTKDVYKVVDQNLEWIMLQDNPVKFLRQHAENYIPRWLENSHGDDQGELKRIEFSDWTDRLLKALSGAVSEDAWRIKLGRQLNPMEAKLMREISRSTYYG